MKIALALLVSMYASATAFCGTVSDRLGPSNGSWEAIALTGRSPDMKFASYFVTTQNPLEEGLRLLNINTGESSPVGSSRESYFSPDGRWFVRHVEGKGVVLKEMSSVREFTYPCGQEFRFSHNSRYLTIVSKSQAADDPCSGKIQSIELLTMSVSAISWVQNYRFSQDAKQLAYVAKEGNEQAVSILSTESGVEARSLLSTKSEIQALTWSEEGDALAFLEGFETHEGAASFVVHLYDGKVLRKFDPRHVNVLPSDSLIGGGDLAITKDLSTVLFELKSSGPALSKESVAAPLVQVWHSRDVRVVSDVLRDHKPLRRAAWNFDREKFIDLSVGGRRVSKLSGQGGQLITYVESQPASVSQSGWYNYYNQNLWNDEGDVILESTDLRTGGARVINPKFPMHSLNSLTISPTGQFVAYFYSKHWWIHDLQTGSTRNATVSAKVDLYDTENDKYPFPVPYGSPGWTDDERLVVYDKYDIWLVRADGFSPQRITMGRKERKIHRFHAEEAQPMLPGARVNSSALSRKFALNDVHVLTLFGELSKKSGFATYSMAGGVAEKKFDDVYVSSIFSSPDHRSFIYQEERFDTPPQIVMQGIRSGARRVAARSNLHFGRSTWGAVTTVEYKDDHGRDLQGLLFSPSGYRNGKKYPLIVEIYERKTDGMHKFRYPRQLEYLSVSTFTNDGYFVLLPDIRYGADGPGLHALGAVIAAVSKVVEAGDVDAKAIGLLGESFGGYETAFIITQTNVFSAAVAGSAITDLVSSYLSNEPGMGTPSMWRYERHQMRIRQPLHENAEIYLNNSPVLHAGSVRTPLLSWFGAKDPQIRASQSIEMYNALRRAGKEHVLLIYPEERHSLSPNAELDMSARARQWFDHYLKGAPAAEWMKNGQGGEIEGARN